MRARDRATRKQVLDGKRGYRHRGGLGAFTVAFLVAALLVMGLAASSASASPLSVKKVVTGDLPQLPTQFDLHQLDSSALRTAPGGAAGLVPIVPEPSGARAAGDIFYDGFETATPPWLVGGDPTWAGWDYRAAAGSFSAYCAGSAIQPPGPYANNMDARLWAGPIDLSAVTAAELTFKTYYQTEAGYDGVLVYVSVESGGNGTYYSAMDYSGTSGGAWVSKSVDLTNIPTLGNVCGASDVYVLFRFVSDATNTYEGAYIDEVRVSGSQPPATATITRLTPTHAQTGASVVIAGSNLGASGTVRFGSTTATTSAWSANSVTATVPASLAPGSVSVTVTPTGGSVTNALSFTVDPPSSTAAITSLTPNHAKTGASVAIAGSNLGTSGTVRFGGTSATTSAWSANSVTATVPASLAPGSVSVSVTPTGGSASNALSFTVDPPSGLQQAQWVISGQPRTVKYKGYVTIRGTLSDAVSGLQLPSRRAELCWTDDPTDYGSWVSLGEVDAAPGTGQFSMVVGRLVSRTYFSWFFPGDGQYAAKWSGDVKIMSRASLSRPGFPLKVRRGKRVTAVGTLKPQHTAAQNRQSHTKIYLYRYNRGKYRLVGKYWAKAYNRSSVSKYSVRLVFRKTGKYRARAIHMDNDHAKTTSSWRTFRVR